MVEDDYLGGLGTRGSGKVCFKDIVVSLRSGGDYLQKSDLPQTYVNLQELAAGLKNIQTHLQKELS